MSTLISSFRASKKVLLLPLGLCLSLTLSHGASPAAAPATTPATATATPSALLSVAPHKTSGVYTTGEKVVWDIKLLPEGNAVTTASYVIRKGGLTALTQNTMTFSNGLASVDIMADSPGTLLLEVTPGVVEKNPAKVLGGAVIDPDKVTVSAPAPDDFDAFWKSKIDELTAIPANPVLEKGDSGNPDVEYYKIKMDNIRGTHIQGQLARPAKGEKFPALLIVQYAGVYPLQKKWVIEPASKGWLVLNITAHDLPIDQPKEFYDKLKDGDLKDYRTRDNDDREKSYFLRMFLGCYRAADYLANRPDWNGQILAVTGTSQGGLQAFVTAGLYPKITAMIVNVPAGCDHTGLQVGRKPGWPNWVDNAKGKDEAKVVQTSRYYDAVNFASRIKCPALVGLGLIDTTARPEGILAACNQLKGTKEVVILPVASHKETQGTFALMYKRMAEWKDALAQGKAVPPPFADTP